MDSQAGLIISVEASSPTGTWLWKRRFQDDATIRDVKCQWASAHKVREDGIEFESAQGEILDVSCQASKLSDPNQNFVCIRVWPVAEEYMCEVEDASAAISSPSAAPSEPSRKRARAAPAAEDKDRLCPACHLGHHVRHTRAGACKYADEPGAAQESQVQDLPAAAEKFPPELAATSGDPLPEAVAKAPAKQAPAKQATKDTASPAASKGGGGAAASSAASVEDLDRRLIKFQSTNPKLRGGASFERYEKYKHAKTVAEALALGAARGDIQHDVKRGFATIKNP